MRDKHINKDLKKRVCAYFDSFWAFELREKKLEDIVLNSLPRLMRQELL